MIREATSIVGDLTGIASTGVRAVRTRLELLAIELKEEKAWAVRSLLVGIAALYLLTFGLLLAVFALALWASEENRPLIVAVFAGIFLVAGVGSGVYVYLAGKHRQPWFKNTVSVLKGDEAALKNVRGAGD